MTVSRLERPAGRYFSGVRTLPRSSVTRPENQCRTFTKMALAPAFLTRDLREIRNLTGSLADAGEQRQAIGTHGHVLIIHENMLEK